ncbi:MAG: prepilin-type processing-associated H-X9-DG protein [Rhodothermales bacterium]|jgi:prepilin-type processing-associated H-X9-DG protein
MTYCINTMHNISPGMMMYADDNEGYPPWYALPSGPQGDTWAFPADQYVGGQWRELPADSSWYSNFRSKASPVWWDCPSFGENPSKGIRDMNYGQFYRDWTDMQLRDSDFVQPSESARLTESNHEAGSLLLGNPWIPLTSEGNYNNCTGLTGANPMRHTQSFNIGFIDGHIENYPWQPPATVQSTIASWAMP